MVSSRVTRIFLASIFFSLVASCFAQVDSTQPGTPATSEQPSTIVISVRAKDGATTEVPAADFEITVDKKPATVNQVHRVTGAMNYCLLFDTSGSQKDRFKRQQDQAIQLLSKVVQAGRDSGMLVAFNDQSYLDAEGADPQKFVNAIAKERAVGGTALYDAVISSARRMAKISGGTSLRVMFVLSDGDDNQSHFGRDAAVSALLEAGVKVYAIGNDQAGKRGLNSLKLFAERTGGKAYFPWREKDVDKTLADIADELTHLFAVTYTLPGQKPDGQLHNLEVNSRKKDVSITAPDRVTD